jgi:hypothetical protein
LRPARRNARASRIAARPNHCAARVTPRVGRAKNSTPQAAHQANAAPEAPQRVAANSAASSSGVHATAPRSSNKAERHGPQPPQKAAAQRGPHDKSCKVLRQQVSRQQKALSSAPQAPHRHPVPAAAHTRHPVARRASPRSRAGARAAPARSAHWRGRKRSLRSHRPPVHSARHGGPAHPGLAAARRPACRVFKRAEKPNHRPRRPRVYTQKDPPRRTRRRASSPDARRTATIKPWPSRD